MLITILRWLIILGIVLVCAKLVLMILIARKDNKELERVKRDIILNSLFLFHIDGENSIAYFKTEGIDVRNLNLPNWNENNQSLFSIRELARKVSINEEENIVEIRYRYNSFIKIGENFLFNIKNNEKLYKDSTLGNFIQFMK